MFIGEYTEKLDRKFRLPLPEAYRVLLQEGQHEPRSMFFVAGSALSAYTDQGFGALVFDLYEKLRAGIADEEERMQAHLVGANAQAFIRRNGSVEIPQKFREMYGLDRGEGLSIVGCFDHFEIWKADVHRSITKGY